MKFEANLVEEMSLGAILDQDWHRLTALSGGEQRRQWHSSFSPRFAPIALLRVAYCLHRSGWRRLAKFFSLVNFLLFGLEVPATLPIGPGLVIPHTQGTVIGAGYIGSNVTIYQQVTFGAKMADFGFDPKQRPRIDDGAIITSGAKVLGAVRVGKNAIIGANAVVLNDVPDNTVVGGIPARILGLRSASDAALDTEQQ